MKKNGNKLGKRKERLASGQDQEPVPPFLPGLPPEVGVQLRYIEQVRSIMRSGPLPDPDTLAEYERVQPGLVERIVTMAEQQAAHRRDIELRTNNSETGDRLAERIERRRGQYLAFGVVGLVLLLAGYVATLGHEIAAAIISGVPITGLIVAFITGQIKAGNGKANDGK